LGLSTTTTSFDLAGRLFPSLPQPPRTHTQLPVNNSWTELERERESNTRKGVKEEEEEVWEEIEVLLSTEKKMMVVWLTATN
jgi:hypothetical protein